MRWLRKTKKYWNSNKFALLGKLLWSDTRALWMAMFLCGETSVMKWWLRTSLKTHHRHSQSKNWKESARYCLKPISQWLQPSCFSEQASITSKAQHLRKSALDMAILYLSPNRKRATSLEHSLHVNGWIQSKSNLSGMQKESHFYFPLIEEWYSHSSVTNKTMQFRHTEVGGPSTEALMDRIYQYRISATWTITVVHLLDRIMKYRLR